MTDPVAQHDVIVVGGGPAGLAAAWHLRDADVHVLEATDRLGGRLKSLPRGEYWINLGGHLFPGQGSHMQELLAGLGLGTIPIPGAKFALAFDGEVHRRSRVETYVATLPLTLRERLALVRVGLKMRKGVRAWQKALEARPGETEATRRERVACFLSDRTMRDLIGRPPERIDAIFRSAGRRAGAELEQQSAGVGVSLFGAVWSGAKSTMALNLDGGSGRFGEAMEKQLTGRVSYGARVTHVAATADGVRVAFEKDGEQHTLHARQVVMATPAAVARSVVSGLAPEVASALAAVTTGPFLVLGILTSETGPMPYDDIYATTTPDQSFDMLFNHANPLRRKGERKPGGSLMLYAGGEPARELMKRTDNEIVETYLTDLLELYPQLRGAIAETVLQRWEIGNVYRSPGMSFLPMIRYCERDDTAIHFCGDYFGEIGNMEFATGSGTEAARRVKARLEREVAAGRA